MMKGEIQAINLTKTTREESTDTKRATNSGEGDSVAQVKKKQRREEKLYEEELGLTRSGITRARICLPW